MVYKDCPERNDEDYCLGGNPEGVLAYWLVSVSVYFGGALFAFITLSILLVLLYLTKSAAGRPAEYKPPASAAIPPSVSTASVEVASF